MPGYIGQVYPQAPVAPDSVNEVALNVPELQAAGLMPTAWCTFDGTLVGTNAPIDGFNVASVTRNSVGNYTITFITPMDITAFNVTGGIDSTTVGANSFLSVLNYRNKLVTSVDIYTGYFATSNVFSDYGEVSIQIFGGKN